MTDAFQPNLDFAAVEQADEHDAFVVDLEGYEGRCTCCWRWRGRRRSTC